jgi:hypothetical protein
VKKIYKYTLRIVGGLFGLLILVYIVLSIYVTVNKEALLKKATMEISNITGGKATVADLSVSVFNNFPYLAIALSKIDIRDSLFSRHGHRFFYAEKLFLRLNPVKLLMANISINKLEVDSGSFYLFTDTSGYTNSYLLKPQQKSPAKENTSTTKSILDKIQVTRTSLTLDDRQKGKLFDVYINKLTVKTNTNENNYHFSVNESILVRSLAFNLSIGTYLQNQLLEGSYAVNYSTVKKELSFDSIPISISKHPFRISGNFLLDTVQQFALRVNAKNITVDFAKSLLTKKTAKGISLVQLKAPVDVQATLNGSLEGGNPLIVARWQTEKNALATPLLNFDDCSFSGLYTNRVNPGSALNDDNSKVEVYKFKGNWEGLTMRSDSILINNLSTPVVAADMRSDFPLTALNEALQTDALALTAGKGKLMMRYKGPFDHITPGNASVNGSIQITDGNILVNSSQSNLSECNASIHFINADILIDSLNCRLHNAPVRFSGAAKNALALLGETSGNVALTLNAFAPVLNIDHLNSILYRKIPAKKKSTGHKNSSLAKTAQKIDNLLSSGHVDVNLSADKLIYHKFEAHKAVVNIVVDENSWVLQKAALMHGNGSMAITGKVAQQPDNRFALTAQLQMKNVDAQKVWYEFENFGIPALSYKNIKGILSTEAKLSMLLDQSGNFDLSTLNGEADFSIKNGALIQFKPLQEVQKVAFKSRDFTDVSFAEIKDKILFNKGIVTINRMEINSTVLSLFVEGQYGLNGNTDISIQVPLSNLKKRDKDYKPENTGAGRSGGMSIFLRAKTAEDGTIKIKYDPFKRFRKSNAIK